MGLYWSSSDTVTNGQLKALIEDVPTYAEVGAIVKANAGGSAKIKSLLGSATSQGVMGEVLVGETKKVMLCGSDSCYGGMCASLNSRTTTASLNGGDNIEVKGMANIFLPKDTVISIKNTGSEDLCIKGIGQLYEVE